VSEEGKANAAAALREAFARLAPQGSDPWNFQAAFTHLSDRYGPDHPGASAMAEQLATEKSRRNRFRGRGARPASDSGQQHDLEDAMGHVIEAFRFLSARVRTLEGEMAHQHEPLHGPAWLTPAQPLGAWSPLIARHIAGASPVGDVLHADCGDGSLLTALQDAGVSAIGVEPRGGVALGPLERGHRVTIDEAVAVLAGAGARSLGGAVLSGVVDRLPLADLTTLLSRARHAMAPGSPLVVVATLPEAAAAEWSATASDVVAARPMHSATWEFLLARAGFVDSSGMDGPGAEASRIAFSASVPR
jgi:hypothetical protein